LIAVEMISYISSKVMIVCIQIIVSFFDNLYDFNQAYRIKCK